MTTYRVIKAYLLVDENHTELGTLAAVLTFQSIWHDLTKPQRAALLADDRTAISPITLDKLRQHQLIDSDGRTTIVGEAVRHYRPDGPIGHALLELTETAKASPHTTTREDGTT